MNDYLQALQLIAQFIVTNGNKDITAAVLKPVLDEIVKACRDTTGLKENLATTDQTSLVAAINELKAILNNVNSELGVQIYYGTTDPTVTPPPTFKAADFYLQQSSENDPLQLWQYNGFVWENVVYGSSATTPSPHNESFEYAGGTVTIPATLQILKVTNYNNLGKRYTATKLGDQATIIPTPEIDDYIEIIGWTT